MGKSELFRKQAIDHHVNRLHGEIMILPKISHSIVTLFIVVWVVLVSIWAANNNYAKKETVIGWLEPENGLAKVYSEFSGIVKEVMVSEGELVEAGQPIVKIHANRLLQSGEDMEGVLLSEYKKQEEMLRLQVGRSKLIYEKKLSAIESRISTAEKNVLHIESRMNVANERYDMQEALLKRYQQLEKGGHVSSAQVESVLMNRLDLQSKNDELLMLFENSTSLASSLRKDEDILNNEELNEDGLLKVKLSNLTAQIIQMEMQRTQIIRASRTGYVTNLQAKIGQQIVQGDGFPLVMISPSEHKLMVQLLVPARSSGFLEKGQKLDIRYEAFPYQKFGLHAGDIRIISDSIIMPHELKDSPLVVREPVYRVQASIASQSIRAYGTNLPLKSGMLLSADIRLGERTVLQWMLEPLYSLKGKI